MGELGFPAGPDELDAAWLTTALRSRGAVGDDVAVGAFEAEPIGVGIGILSLLWRLHLDYAEGDGPTTAILKLPHTVQGARETAHAFNFYGREVGFYTDVGLRTPLGTAACYAADLDPETQDFVLLLEDLGGRVQYDQLDGCSIDDAVVAAKEVAAHHARWWEDQAIIDAPWTVRTCDPPNPQALPPTLRQSWPTIEGEFAHLIPGPLLDMARRMPDACVELLERLSEPPLTLVHGDYRLDNLFFAGDGDDVPVKAVDWQICGLGRSAYDIAYLMSQSLTPEDRKDADDVVLRAYHGALTAGGVDYSYEQCWEDYRLATLFCACYPLNAGALDLVNDRAVALFEAMLTRSMAAITDLDALELMPS